MLSIISGWYFVPRNAVVHPLAKKPLLDSLIPIAIVCALAVGISLIVTGFA
jgi:hypothetical protein